MNAEPMWWITKDGDEICYDLFRRHYSRRIYRDGRCPKLFCGPGEKLVLRTWHGDALFVWRKFKDLSFQKGINCAIFRNESPFISSALIYQADEIANAVWPGERHYTYINAKKVKSINPGYCFLWAGWRKCGYTKSGLVIMEYIPSCQG